MNISKCAKAYKILAQNTKDPQEAETYLHMSEQLKKINNQKNKIKSDGIKFAHRLQPGINTSTSLSKITKNNNNRIRYDNITRSLQNLQKYFLNIK